MELQNTLLSGRVGFAVCGFCVLTLPFVLLIQFRDSTRQTDRLPHGERQTDR